MQVTLEVDLCDNFSEAHTDMLLWKFLCSPTRWNCSVRSKSERYLRNMSTTCACRNRPIVSQVLAKSLAECNVQY